MGHDSALTCEPWDLTAMNLDGLGQFASRSNWSSSDCVTMMLVVLETCASAAHVDPLIRRKPGMLIIDQERDGRSIVTLLLRESTRNRISATYVTPCCHLLRLSVDTERNPESLLHIRRR